MIRYVIKRILLLIPVIVIVSFIVFTLMELTPGTVVDAIVAAAEEMTPEAFQALIEYHNLHRSMFYRFGLYMINLFQGDLGVGDYTRISVWYLFISRLPNTLILSFTALIFGMAIAIPLGIFAARRSGKLVDSVTTGFSMIGMSMPVFWIGVLLLIWFSMQIQLFPAGGFRHGWRSLVLPAICSGLTLTAIATRQTRSSMLEVLKSDYLRTARAKGVPERVVIRKHALGNAWIPIVTALGTSLSTQLAGAVVVESVFTWPGIGRLAAEAVAARDVTTTTGVVVMTTILYVLVHLVVDVAYAFIDPRIKAQYISGGKKKKRSAAASSGLEQIMGVSEQELGSPAAEPLAVGANVEEVPEMLPQESFAAATANAQAERAVSASQASEAVPTKSFITRENFEVAYEIAEDEDNNEPASSVDSSEDDSNILYTSKYKKRSQLGEIFYNLTKNKGAIVGLVIIALLFLTFFASLFISWDAVTVSNVGNRLSPPTWQHPFGTDGMGRDAFMRVIYGTRYSLAISFGAAAIAMFFGIGLGSFAGYFGGLADELIMRFSDILASIPGILLGMVIVTVLGQSLPNLIIAVGVAAIPIYIRITRAAILTVRNQEFIEAAKAIGLSNIRIIFTQVLPNSLAPLIVTFSANLGMNVIVAASISFLGFGVPVPAPEWGSLIAMNRDFGHVAQYLLTFPGLFIMVTVLAFNLLGDGLRDALDPKLKKR